MPTVKQKAAGWVLKFITLLFGQLQEHLTITFFFLVKPGPSVPVILPAMPRRQQNFLVVIVTVNFLIFLNANFRLENFVSEFQTIVVQLVQTLGNAVSCLEKFFRLVNNAHVNEPMIFIKPTNQNILPKQNLVRYFFFSWGKNSKLPDKGP